MVVTVVFLTGMVLTGFSGHAQSRDEILSMIRGAEKVFANAEIEFQWGMYQKKEDVGNVEAFPRSEGDILMTFGPEAKYTGTTFGRRGWHSGPRPISNQWWSGSYNGKIAMSIDYVNESNAEKKAIAGSVTKEPEEQKLYYEALFGALEHTLPAFKGVGLSQYLEGGPRGTPDWTVLEAEPGGRVSIWFPDYTVGDYAEYKIGHVAVLDFSRGGNIVELSKWYDYGGPKAFRCNELIDLQLEERDGLWVPTRFAINYLSPNQPYTQCSLNWKRLNAEVKDEDFVLEFPEGLVVNDEVAGVRYKVGAREGTLDSSLGEAVATVEQARQPEENAAQATAPAVQDLKELDPAPPVQREKQPVPWLLGAGLAAFVLVIVWLLVRRRVGHP